MLKMQVFEGDFGKLRTVEIDGEVWFVGKDVAAALGYSNARDAIAKHIDEEDKGVANCDTLGGVQELTIINESGLYSLILSSKLPTAKKFKRWVTSEVLPAIRKFGEYGKGTGLRAQTDEGDGPVYVTAEEVVYIVGEVIKKMLPMINPSPKREETGSVSECGDCTLPCAQVRGSMPKAVYLPIRRRGMHNKVDMMPEPMRSLVIEMLHDERIGFQELEDYCRKQGYDISRGSLQRYSMKMRIYGK